MLLELPDLQSQLFGSAGGSAIKNVRPLSEIRKIKFVLPPLQEQRRIAEVLDRAEALRAKRRAALARLDALTQSIFLDLFGDPVVRRSAWPVSTLHDVCEKITDGTHKSPPITQSGFPYVTAKHLSDYGLDFESDPWFISEEDHRAIFSRCDPRPGDVLYIKDGGITAPQKNDPTLVPRWGTPTQLMRKKTASKDFLQWLYEWFYQDTSRNAHLSSSGLFSVSPFVLAEIVGGYEKEIVESHIIETFRFTQISRLALTTLAIMTEVSTHFALGNYESIVYLWQIFVEQTAEGKDLYKQRYNALIDNSRT